MDSTVIRVGTTVIFVGIIMAHYNSSFRNHHKLCMSILKRFGFGQRVMETRILMEVEEMLNKVREQQGRAFDVKQLTTSCVANVIMNMVYGRRFDHSDPTFQQCISVMDEVTARYLTLMVIDIFPILRFIPYLRRTVAELKKLRERINDKWIKVNTTSSLQVCYSSSTSKMLYSLKQDKTSCFYHSSSICCRLLWLSVTEEDIHFITLATSPSTNNIQTVQCAPWDIQF